MIIGIDASRANQPERTGTEWYAWQLVRRLPSLLSEHTVRLYVREELLPDLSPLAPNVEVRILRWRPGVLWSHLRLSWEMLRHQPDVLFVPANTVPLIHPRKTITTIHDVAFERFPELYRGRSVQRRLGWLRPVVHALVRICTLGRYSASERDYHRWSSRQAVRSAATILTVSEFSKQEIISTLGARADKVVVTHLGAPQPEEFTISPELQRQVREKFELVRPFMLFIGRLETKKNIDGLLRSYLLYRQTYDHPIDLVLAGQPGFGWDKVEPLARQLIHQGVIHHIGWVNTEDKIVLEKSARVFIFISRYEGFGLPPLESMSAGVPVIASRVGSLPEVLGSAAYFVDGEDPAAVAKAMDELSRDTATRKKFIEAGSGRVGQFSWQRTAEQTAREIQAVAALSKA